MTPRVGSVKWTALIILGTIVILACMAAAAWYSAREMEAQTERARQELEKSWQKMQDDARETQAKSDKLVIASLKKGGAFVSGARFSAGAGSAMSVPGVPKGQETTCAIDWSVPQADYARIAAGMTLDEVRRILDLSALHYIPDGPESRFVLHCTWANRKVTLVFGGDPEVKLLKKSADGAQ